MPQILAGLLLVLALASQAGDFGTLYTIRKDASYLQQADKMLGDARKRATEELADARNRADAITEARARAKLAAIQQVEYRSNVSALVRQLQQADESFRESNLREFYVWVLTMAGGYKMPGLEHAWNANSAILDAVTLGKPRAQTARDALDTTQIGVAILEKPGPLPVEIGDYLRQSIWTRIKQENAQIGTLSQYQQDRFLCDQTKVRLNQLIRGEQNAARLDILRSALSDQEVQCSQVVGRWKLAPDAGTSVKNKYFREGLWEMSLAVTLDKPPSEIVAGTTVTLTANATFNGFISPSVAGPPGGPFEFRASVPLSAPSQMLVPTTKQDDGKVQGQEKLAVTFVVPEPQGDITKASIRIDAFIWGCTEPGCSVSWVYRPE